MSQLGIGAVVLSRWFGPRQTRIYEIIGPKAVA